MPTALGLVASLAHADDLPSGGTIVDGSGSIARDGKVLTVTQQSQNLVINWQDFSIGQDYSVHFQQPNATATALNTVLGSSVSVISGHLSANGRLILVNPNGVEIGSGAHVDVGGLIASTYKVKTEDFLAGRYVFEGDSPNTVKNSGTITATPGGTVALIAAKIVNDGTISAEGGNVLIGAGSRIVLDLGGPVKIEVEQGALDTLIEQGGAVRADGGNVYLTAKAAGDLASSVINHTGVTEARTLSTGSKGEIVLLGDEDVGTTRVAGTLDAGAPNGGDGGLIETSGAHVELAANTRITAGAADGRGGEWRVDPVDYTIDATAAGNIAAALNTGTSVTISTNTSNSAYGAGGGSNGDITVASDIAKTNGGDAALSLVAANTIVLHAEITSTSGKLDLLLDADNDGGNRDGGGVVIATKGVSLNGGNLDFGTGALFNYFGTNVMTGGDVYIGGTDKVVFATGGGDINLFGELIIANPEGVKFATGNGDATYWGIINSGDKYEAVSFNGDWQSAILDARNGTAGGDAVGDSYMATVTSRLENAVVGNTIDYQPSFLGGQRVIGIGTNDVWRWTQGPEGLADSGNGQPFFIQNGGQTGSGNGGSNYSADSFSNWNGGFAGEPNNYPGQPMTVDGESIIEIVNLAGQWNDRPDFGYNLPAYVRETNYDAANLEIDAGTGTGTVTFKKDIGGLKPIHYTAYDASNPKPSSTPATPPVAPTTPGTTGAIGAAQAIGSQAASGAQSGPTAPGQTQAFLGAANGGTGATANGGSGDTQTAIGSLRVVNIDSGGTGNSDTAGNGDDPLTAAGIDSHTESSGQTTVYVLDGGIRAPDTTTDDDDQN